MITKFLRHTGGNVALVFALSFVMLVSAVGGSIDIYHAYSARNDLQDAVDAAVLAGVRASSASMGPVASKAFGDDISSAYGGASQSYSSAFASSSAASSSVLTTTLSGTASLDTPTWMLKLVGINSLNVQASATAIGTTPLGTPAATCIYVLDPSGSQALLVNSGAQMSASGCEIDVKSTGNPAGMFNSGSSLNFKKVCIKGTQVTQNSTTVPNLSLGCPAADDPYAGTLPTPASSTCTYFNLNYSAASQTMSPGVYCGWFNFNNSSANVTFQPGVYVIEGGGWNVNGGTWSGNGVTFYFADTSKIQFNSGISANLSAPSSGTYKNLLMYEASGLAKSQFVLNDSVANKLTGVIWLPSRELTMNAKSGVQSDALTLVVWRLILNNTTWTLTSLGGGGSSATGAMAAVRLTR